MSSGTLTQNYTLSLGNSDGASVAGIVQQSLDTTGSNLVNLVNPLTNSVVAVNIGALASIGVILILNLSTVNALVYRDAGGTQLISSIPPQMGISLFNPGFTPYAKVGSGTGSLLITASEP